MRRSRLFLTITCAAALLAVVAFGVFFRAPEGSQPNDEQAAAPGISPAMSRAQVPECSEALGANPLGGLCIPRALRGAPPDPGPDNDKTLAGIDSNGNGVRDDIERYIAANHGESSQKVAYLMQYARAVAPFVRERMNSPAEALKHSAHLSRTNACAARLIGPADRAMTPAELRRFDEWLDAAQAVEIQHLNTADRLARFIENERMLSGQGLTLENWNSAQAACDFPAADRSAQPTGEK